jgi:hypothetical protein
MTWTPRETEMDRDVLDTIEQFRGYLAAKLRVILAVGQCAMSGEDGR